MSIKCVEKGERKQEGGYGNRTEHTTRSARNTGDTSVPTRLAGCQYKTVLIAAAAYYTMAVASSGALWAWGGNRYGQLGLGDVVDRMVPARVGAEETFAGSRVMMAA